MPLVAPVELLLALDVTGIQAHEEDSCLGLLLEDAVLEVEQAFGQDVEDRADGDVGGLDRGVLRVTTMRRIGVKAGSSPGPDGPPFQKVRDMLFCGIGPRPPRTGSRTGRANRLIAPPRVYLRSGRRLSLCLATLFLHDAHDLVPVGVRAAGGRISTTSSSGMRVLAQCTAPSPIPSRGQAHADPEQDVLQAHVADARQVGHGADVDEEVGQHEGTVPRIDRVNRPATCFSARLAAASLRSAPRGT